MKIAILISGRITRYDVCLVNFLNNISITHDADLFISINDENNECDYFKIMRKKLKQWIKCCEIKKYVIPQEIIDIFNPNESIGYFKNQANLQKINNKWLPYNCLSMYYNDNNCYKMALNYADINNFEYDVFLKYRSDIINTTIPDFSNVNSDEYNLHCAVPMCNFLSNGIFRKPIVCDIFAWGNKKSMNIYCNTYNYVIDKIKEYYGKYYVAGECSLTDNIYSNNLPVTYYNIRYSLDKNRRMFDDINNDTRKPIPNQSYFMKITDTTSDLFIEPCKQE